MTEKMPDWNMLDVLHQSILREFQQLSAKILAKSGINLCLYRVQHLEKPRRCQIPVDSIAGIEELRTYLEDAIKGPSSDTMLSVSSISKGLVLC